MSFILLFFILFVVNTSSGTIELVKKIVFSGPITSVDTVLVDDTCFIFRKLEDLIKEADTIVIGKVETIERVSPDYVYVTFDSEEYLKTQGDPEPKIIIQCNIAKKQVMVLYSISDLYRFRNLRIFMENERALLFLKKSSSGDFYSLLSGCVGKFSLDWPNDNPLFREGIISQVKEYLKNEQEK